MIVRRHALVVGGFARTMEGEVVRITDEKMLLGKVRMMTVRFPQGQERQYLEGFLEPVNSAYAP